MATRSKSSQRWLKEHHSDPFVKKAQAEGLRSRAAYKLEELVERDRLLKPGMVVVDLGAAPGGWSQWVRAGAGRHRPGQPGRVIALDILEMPTLAGVEFLHGDFREDAVLSQLVALLGGKPVDLVLSDMAPNKSGVDAVDMPRAMYLSELAMDFADQPPAHRRHVPDQAVPGRGLRRIREGTAPALRQGVDPQARGLAQAVAGGLRAGTGQAGAD